jgi:hypothetical protein
MDVETNESGRFTADRSIPLDARLQTVSRIVKMDEDARRITHVISTARLDRGGRYIEQAGWQLGEYRANNVVVANHDYDIQSMIGNGVDVAVVKDELQATTEFGPEALGPLAFRLVQSGMAKAWSVGWIGSKGHHIGDEEECEVCAKLKKKTDWGYHFVKQTLLEYSLVAVPANPDAVLRLQAAGFKISKTERDLWASLGEAAGDPEPDEPDPECIARSAVFFETTWKLQEKFRRASSIKGVNDRIKSMAAGIPAA